MAKAKNYKQGAVTWLRMVEYMHGWLSWELGCEVRAHDRRVLSVQHLEGAREVLRMQTVEDMMEKQPLGIALSATRRNCFDAGLRISPETMRDEYGVTKEALDGFVPIECPKMCLTKNGVLRPWTLDVCFGKDQARQLQKLLRAEFWKAVDEFDREYAEQEEGRKYPAREMVEEFCAETRTPDMYVDEIRREWQRRKKREKD